MPMTDHTTIAISPLALKLQELVNAGLVVIQPQPSMTDFPSARVIVPVYDSNGTQPLHGQELARHIK
jgi:hypothetical protein